MTHYAGDYDGDGKADLAVFRSSSGTWFVLQSSSGYSTYSMIPFGTGIDVPVSGDSVKGLNQRLI